MDVLSKPKPTFHTPWTFTSKTTPKRERKPRRPEIFNTSFSFSFRRRRSSSYTPEVSPRSSPRSSISGWSSSPAHETSGFKRQRIDSSSSTEEWACGRPEITRRATVDPHPGQLVEFTAEVSTIPEEEGMGNEAYHEYLATTPRRNTFPSTVYTVPYTREDINDTPSFSMETSYKRVDNTISTSPSVDTTPAPLRRTTSDPCTDAFLTHVRASLEARKNKAGKWYPVFVDEEENGFLGDEPL